MRAAPIRPSEALERAAHALGAPVPGLDGVEATERGVRFVLRICEDDGTRWFEATVPLAGLANVSLEPEGRFARLGKRLGLSTEVQLGDPSFDPIVYVDTEVDEAVLRAYLGAEGRAAIAEIVGSGDRVQLSGQGVSASLRWEDGLDVERAVRTVRALVRFVAALPSPLPTFPPEPAPRRWPLRLALVLHVVGWLGMGASLAVGPYRALLGQALGVGVNALLTAAAMPLFVLRFRRRADGFAALLGNSLGLFLWLLPAGPTIVHLLNASLDLPPESRPVTVASSRCGEEEDGPFTDVVVEEGEDRFELRLTGCSTPPADAPMRLVTSPGGLGLLRVYGLEAP
jgi:hypothetical protein